MAYEQFNNCPVGTIVAYYGNNTPLGWLLCDGRAITQNSYPDLYALIGSSVPDLRGIFVRGLDNGRSIDPGRQLGTYQEQDFKSFTAFDTNVGSTYSHNMHMGKVVTDLPQNIGGTKFFLGKWETPASGLSIGWDASEIRPKNLALNYIIKAVNIHDENTASASALVELNNKIERISVDEGPIQDLIVMGNIVGHGGTISGFSRVYNSVYNDYAEYFPRKCPTEPGDIIALSNDSEENYELATSSHSVVIGVHSEEYAYVIGGEEAPLGWNFHDWNEHKSIPVGLAGRLHVKFIGKAKKGTKIVASEIPGVGREYDSTKDDFSSIIGFSLENNDCDDVKKIKMKIL